MIDPNEEKPGKSEDAGSFGLIILIVFVIAMLYAIGLVLINKHSTQSKPAAVIPTRVDLKLAEQVLDTIEDYYLVNKADRRTVKVLCLEKIKIDTITIK